MDSTINACLPMPIGNILEWIQDKEASYKQISALHSFLSAITALFGYFLVQKYGSRYGITLPIAGCLAAPISNTICVVGVGGRLVTLDIKGAISAGQAKDVVNCAKQIAFAALGYMVMTPKVNSFSWNLVRNFIINKST